MQRKTVSYDAQLHIGRQAPVQRTTARSGIL